MRYGNKIVTSRSSLTLTELGIDESATAIDGCEIVDGIVTVTKDVATLNVDGKVFVIEKCDADAIEIQNKKFYEHTDDGYVLAVGEHTLKLAAIWTDMTNRTELSNVVWTSNNQSVATVGENGEVKGLSNGLVTITATANGKSASVTINVQNKLASVQLRTSEASLAVGLARETVFASQRFANPTNVKSDDSKIANSTRIVVEGEKVGATEEELELFYSAYDFEVVKGGEYAYFDDTIRNMLVFKDEGKALEGKGRQQIVVRVSAKYPKYEGMTKFTTQEVTLNAIFGVAVSSVAELEAAAKYQRAYAEASENVLGAQKGTKSKTITTTKRIVFKPTRIRRRRMRFALKTTSLIRLPNKAKTLWGLRTESISTETCTATIICCQPRPISSKSTPNLCAYRGRTSPCPTSFSAQTAQRRAPKSIRRRIQKTLRVFSDLSAAT